MLDIGHQIDYITKQTPLLPFIQKPVRFKYLLSGKYINHLDIRSLLLMRKALGIRGHQTKEKEEEKSRLK